MSSSLALVYLKPNTGKANKDEMISSSDETTSPLHVVIDKGDAKAKRHCADDPQSTEFDTEHGRAGAEAEHAESGTVSRDPPRSPLMIDKVKGLVDDPKDSTEPVLPSSNVNNDNSNDDADDSKAMSSLETGSPIPATRSIALLILCR